MVCKTCKNSYELKEEGYKCEAFATPGNNCLWFKEHTEDKCLKCETGHFLDSGTCVALGGNSIANCKDYWIKKETVGEGNNGFLCAECEEGYHFEQNPDLTYKRTQCNKDISSCKVYNYTT